MIWYNIILKKALGELSGHMQMTKQFPSVPSPRFIIRAECYTTNIGDGTSTLFKFCGFEDLSFVIKMYITHLKQSISIFLYVHNTTISKSTSMLTCVYKEHDSIRSCPQNESLQLTIWKLYSSMLLPLPCTWNGK